MYTLLDTHNDSVLSRHRTLRAAARARRAHSRAVRRYHGPSSYIPTTLLDAAGGPIRDGHPEHDEWLRAIDAATEDR